MSYIDDYRDRPPNEYDRTDHGEATNRPESKQATASAKADPSVKSAASNSPRSGNAEAQNAQSQKAPPPRAQTQAQAQKSQARPAGANGAAISGAGHSKPVSQGLANKETWVAPVTSDKDKR